MSFELGGTSPLETNEVKDVKGRSIRQPLMLLRRSLNPYDFYVVMKGWAGCRLENAIPLSYRLTWRSVSGGLNWVC